MKYLTLPILLLLNGCFGAAVAQTIPDSLQKYSDLYTYYVRYERVYNQSKVDSILNRYQFFANLQDGVRETTEKKRLETKYKIKIK